MPVIIAAEHSALGLASVLSATVVLVLGAHLLVERPLKTARAHIRGTRL